MTKKTTTTATARKGATALPFLSLNWPPSRGPTPRWMRRRLGYVVPSVEVIALPIRKKERSPTGGPGSTYLSLWQQIEACATLRPRQWKLVGGASLGRFSKGSLHRATLETSLPVLTNRLSKTSRARPLIFDLSYPLSRIARVTIRPYVTRRLVTIRDDETKRLTKKTRVVEHEEMNVGYVLWQLARAYQRIYREHRKYGVWGHAIEDLWFEGMEIRGDVGHVEIGS